MLTEGIIQSNSKRIKVILLLALAISAISIPAVYLATNEETKAPQMSEAEDQKSSVVEHLETRNSAMEEEFFSSSQPEPEEEKETEIAEKPKNKDRLLFSRNRGFEDGSLKKNNSYNDYAKTTSYKHSIEDNLSARNRPEFLQQKSLSERAFSNAPLNENQDKKSKLGQYIDYDHDELASPLELISDKDYPSTTASPRYDLSRMLTTDSFIPAVMYTAINSEIPSKTVLAIVESDVTGFAGRNILIPKGSKIEGVYEALENKHARRMQITWFKITRPDGIIIKLSGESADMQGAGGIGGYLDQRLKDRYGGAILLSTINAMAQMSVRQNDIRQLAAAESFGREFGTLTAQIIRENINTMPIIMIAQGTRFNIRPHENIYFPKAKNKQIELLVASN